MNMNNDKLQTVEELIRRTGASYSEAKEALENSGWDMLDAIVYLENKGKVSGNVKFRKQTGKLCDKLKKAWNYCCSHDLVITREAKTVASLPLTAAILIGLLLFELVLPAAVIALLFGCTFSLAVNGKYTGVFTEDSSKCGFDIH